MGFRFPFLCRFRVSGSGFRSIVYGLGSRVLAFWGSTLGDFGVNSGIYGRDSAWHGALLRCLSLFGSTNWGSLGSFRAEVDIVLSENHAC